MNFISKLRPLVAMQLKDKLDFSFLQSTRSLIFKIVLGIIKFVVVTAVFYLLFFVCNIFSIFRPAGVIPDTVVNVIFVIIQLLSLITCTAGLVNVLYMTADNRVLLTLPAGSTTIYISKLIVYYIFELKKNLTFTLPVFLAYGITNGAVWYYYIWLLVCFVFISLLPVAIGAVLSIPALYATTFIKHFKWLQFILISLATAFITYVIVILIKKIPANINIMGQWGTIFLGIQNFLTKFSNIFKPYYLITRMMVGGTLRISAKMFGIDTLIITVCFLAGLCLLLGISFLFAKPMFVKMASKQFEFEKMVVPPKKNKIHRRLTSPYFESMVINLRSTSFLINSLIQIVLPSIAILLLNRLYAAMNTNFSGQVMTKTFNLLVMLLLVVSFNNEYATVYSKEASARNILKSRPIQPIHVLFGRISVRIIIIILSTIAVTMTYLLNSNAEKVEIILMGIITCFIGLAHLLWCAELDVMHSYADQYATVGMQFDSPNERNATIIGFIISIFLTFIYYFLGTDRGTLRALIIALIITVVFMVARVYLFITRAKLYFVES